MVSLKPVDEYSKARHKFLIRDEIENEEEKSVAWFFVENLCIWHDMCLVGWLIWVSIRDL